MPNCYLNDQDSVIGALGATLKFGALVIQSEFTACILYDM